MTNKNTQIYYIHGALPQGIICPAWILNILTKKQTPTIKASDNIPDTFNTTGTKLLRWSGQSFLAMYDNNMHAAAECLAQEIKKQHRSDSKATFHIYGHCLGGTIALFTAELLKDENITITITTIATPLQTKTTKPTNISLTAKYNNYDYVQALAALMAPSQLTKQNLLTEYLFIAILLLPIALLTNLTIITILAVSAPLAIFQKTIQNMFLLKDNNEATSKHVPCNSILNAHNEILQNLPHENVLTPNETGYTKGIRSSAPSQ